MASKAVFEVPLSEVQALVAGDAPAFPKYTTQIMNMANQTAQGTRPKVVGQMSHLVPECPAADYEGWVDWYQAQRPSALADATERVWRMVQNYQEAAHRIDREMVEEWVKDLVLTKTYIGLMTQKAVLEVLADKLRTGPVRAAGPEDEARGIDGYLGDRPVSVKPHTYKGKILPERLAAPVVYYTKTNARLTIDASALIEALER